MKYLFNRFGCIVLLLMFAWMLPQSCSKDIAAAEEEIPVTPDPDENKGDLNIKDVKLQPALYIAKGKTFSIEGKGFEKGDVVTFSSLTKNKDEISLKVIEANDNNATLLNDIEVEDDRYTLTVNRNKQSQRLGVTNVYVVQKLDIPDKAGMTVKGMVHVGGIGKEGVVVSDGYEVAITDKEGIYYLPSEKKAKHVYISLPGNYEVKTEKKIPQIHKNLLGGKEVEIRDFELIESPNEEHVLLLMADLHLAKRNSDLQQFQQGFVKDINQTINRYKAQGKKVYGLTLGDLSWDLYWYSNNFGLKEYVDAMQDLDVDVFNVIGNHDNDPYYADDWSSENSYRTYIGPTYYSFNLGQVHYIVLDNTEYINKGGSRGIVGDRSYNEKIVENQIEWLKKDLATIKDKSTPIVIAMHIPMHSNPTLDANGQDQFNYRLKNNNLFVEAIRGFQNVEVVSGHSHINYRINNKDLSLKEQNIAAVCATWWWTGRPGYANNHISRDGSPGGYSVWEMNGRERTYFYKSIGYDEDYQFRAYDLNEVHITAEKYVPEAVPAYKNDFIEKYAKDYAHKSQENEVLLNIWGYEDDWKIEVTENGKKLNVNRVRARDPLHLISYTAHRYNRNSEPSFNTILMNHFFKVKASSATSTLNIKVTDSFGKVYEEAMTRPKAFEYSMR